MTQRISEERKTDVEWELQNSIIEGKCIQTECELSIKPKKVRKWRLFSNIDLLAVQEYLEEMAAKGLFFVRRCGAIYIFERGLPARKRYYVDLFDKSSNIGGDFINEDTREYIEYCQECGWKHLQTSGKMQFFIAEKEDAPLIHTDPKLQLQMIRKSLRVENLCWLLVVFLYGFNFWNILFSSDWPTGIIENGNVSMSFVLLGILVLFQLIRCYRFYFRNKKRADAGESLQFSSGKSVKRIGRVMQLICIVLVLLLLLEIIMLLPQIGRLTCFGILAAAVVAWSCIQLLFSGNRIKKGSGWRVLGIIAISVFSIAVLTVFLIVGFCHKENEEIIQYYDAEGDFVAESISHEQIPVTFQSMGIELEHIVADSTDQWQKSVSVFGTSADYSQCYYGDHGDTFHLDYTIANCRFGWVQNRIVDLYLNGAIYSNEWSFLEATSAERKLWDARKVYAVTSGESDQYVRLVVYDQMVLYIENDYSDFTPEMIRQIRENLTSELK